MAGYPNATAGSALRLSDAAAYRDRSPLLTIIALCLVVGHQRERTLLLAWPLFLECPALLGDVREPGRFYSAAGSAARRGACRRSSNSRSTPRSPRGRGGRCRCWRAQACSPSPRGRFTTGCCATMRFTTGRRFSIRPASPLSGSNDVADPRLVLDTKWFRVVAEPQQRRRAVLHARTAGLRDRRRGHAGPPDVLFVRQFRPGRRATDAGAAERPRRAGRVAGSMPRGASCSRKPGTSRRIWSCSGRWCPTLAGWRTVCGVTLLADVHAERRPHEREAGVTVDRVAGARRLASSGRMARSITR